ncbi:excisionase family DNA-binding protein [Streptomyces cavernae]|uniref:excisionase family DNA-binding protein n=1 Tax=Streptomyces cavernae TaxID=2259034 RepID=UPI000FEB7E4E|nr:excisionase family DNA-binding protein [Streptomyces cavernae]
MPEDTQLLLSPERAADRMDLGRSKIFELMATGELESVLIGRSRRIPLDALKAYVERLRADQGTRAAS